MIAVPDKIAPYLADAAVEKRPPGFSGSQLYIIRQNNGKNNGSFYLKYMPAGEQKSLQREADVMRWLRGALPVPEVVEFETDERGDFLLMTEIPGTSFAEARHIGPEALVKKYADALRRVHEVSIAGCPFDESNEVKARRALGRCETGLVNPDYFREDRLGMSVEDIKKLLSGAPRPKSEAGDLVFTHGDYCFPNVILADGDNDGIGGYIDLSAAGVADRYQDVAVGARSVLFNMKLRGLDADAAEAMAAVFLREYGIERADAEKMEWFQLLDDFFR
ncbi:MAG: aminoglycoside 3'-phosphotransferase [Defluviitaleaceae bacterium]|nr:aminoglycoside 3'-phosphotransferase [Defluviitaleaceae bacterium]